MINIKVLIINELFVFGGAEVQTSREKNILKQHGHEVRLITFDPKFDYGWIEKDHFNIKVDENWILMQMSKIMPNPKTISLLRKLIEEFQPDIIHLNNADTHGLSIFKIVQEYNCIQTLRDYGVVSPNGLGIKPNLQMCDDYKNSGEFSLEHFFASVSKSKYVWQWLCFNRRDKARRQSICHFICPSQMLTDYCNETGLETTCINNPFDFSLIDNSNLVKRTDFHKKKFLYYGQVVEHKGVRQLIKAFSKFAEEKNDVELELVGVLPEEYKETLDKLIEKYGNGKVSYLGKLAYNDMLSNLMSVHTVIIPSLWMENYPNTALEAAATGCMILGSERGGMREIIGSDRFIFEILNQESIIEKMEIAYQISQEEYEEITRYQIERVRRENSTELYYQRLMECFSNIG